MSDQEELLQRLGELAREEDDALENDPRAAELLAPLDASFHGELSRKLGVRPKVVPLWRKFAPAAIGLVAAAAVLAFVVTRTTPTAPEYAMTVTGGDKDVRSVHAPSTLRLSTGSRFEVHLRPEHAINDATARAFLVRNGVARAWDAPIEISPAGAIRVAGETTKLFPDGPGEYGVLILVGKSDVDISAAAKIFADGQPGAHRVQVTVVP